MADSSDLYGCCCLCIFGTLNAWCNTQTFGANGCCNSNTTGCCGSCCDDSFNEDKFDEQVKKNLEKTRDPNAPITTEDQLAPTPDMSPQGTT